MNKKIKAFLDDVCIHINCKTVHKDIREELGEHINELVEENISNGYDEEKALDLAISAMGSTDEIGMKLNRQHKPQTEWSLLILTGFITVIGGIVMFSSSQFTDGQAISFSRYIVFVLIGIGTMTAIYLFDYTKLKKLATYFYLSGILLIGITMAAGIEMNGMRRWLSVGSFSISVPEVASLLFLIAFAGFVETYRMKGAVAIIKLMIQGVLAVCLILIMPSMATAFIMAITYAVILLIAVKRNHFGENKKIQLVSLFAGGAVPAGILIYNITANPYLLERLKAYFPGRESCGRELLSTYGEYLAFAFKLVWQVGSYLSGTWP